jgi:hypothetical protein
MGTIYLTTGANIIYGASFAFSAGASWPSWFLPLVCGQGQRQQSGLEFLVISRWTPICIGVFSEVIRADFVHLHFGPVWKSKWREDHLITHILKPFITEPTENYRASQRINFSHLSVHSLMLTNFTGSQVYSSLFLHFY